VVDTVAFGDNTDAEGTAVAEVLQPVIVIAKIIARDISSL